MKPAKPTATPVDPLHPTRVHSGTGEGATPGDASGPASPASPVRNPAPLPDDAPVRPASQNTEDEGPTVNGYWQHDDSGPRAYVPPQVTQPDDTLGDSTDDLHTISQALALHFETLPDWTDQSIHIRREGGRLRLVGLVTSEVIRRAADRCVTLHTGEPVVNDLIVR